LHYFDIFYNFAILFLQVSEWTRSKEKVYISRVFPWVEKQTMGSIFHTRNAWTEIYFGVNHYLFDSSTKATDI